MDQRSRLQRVPLAFLPQVAGRKLAELPVHQRREVIKGLRVALRPFGQKSRHFMGISHGSYTTSADLIE